MTSKTTPPGVEDQDQPPAPASPQSLLATPPGWATVPSPASATATAAEAASPPEIPATSSAAAAAGATDKPQASIPEFFRGRAKAYAKIGGTLLDAAGGWLNTIAAARVDTATGPVRVEDEAFLPDDDDREAIPPPLGRLAARRIKFGGLDDKELSDIEDAGQLLVGMLAWLAKGASAAYATRRDLRRLAQRQAEQSQDQ